MIYYAILCYTMLYYAILCYTILYSLKVRTQLRKLPNCCLRPEVPHGIRLHVLRASNFFCLTNCIHKEENGTCIDKTHWKNSFSWIEAVTIMQLPTRRVMVSEHQPSSAKILGAGVEILALAQCIQVYTPKCPKTQCSSRGGSELGTAVAVAIACWPTIFIPSSDFHLPSPDDKWVHSDWSWFIMFLPNPSCQV